jgi:hypothetical protein
LCGEYVAANLLSRGRKWTAGAYRRSSTACGSIQNNSDLPQGRAGGFAAPSRGKSIRSQEEYVMTWSDGPWALIYSILVTVLMISWAYVPG